MKYDEKDLNLLHYPRRRHEITKVGEKILADKISAREIFYGVPFKLFAK